MPTMHGICHCSNCKRRTGSAFGISAYFDVDAVVSQAGETKTYALHNEALNHDQRRHFCTRCGTTLFWFVSTLPAKIGIAGGCFGEEDIGDPSYSTTELKRKRWLSLPAHWPCYAG